MSAEALRGNCEINHQSQSPMSVSQLYIAQATSCLHKLTAGYPSLDKRATSAHFFTAFAAKTHQL
jgi:hypothetical protein